MEVDPPQEEEEPMQVDPPREEEEPMQVDPPREEEEPMEVDPSPAGLMGHCSTMAGCPKRRRALGGSQPASQ